MSPVYSCVVVRRLRPPVQVHRGLPLSAWEEQCVDRAQLGAHMMYPPGLRYAQRVIHSNAKYHDLHDGKGERCARGCAIDS